MKAYWYLNFAIQVIISTAVICGYSYLLLVSILYFFSGAVDFIQSRIVSIWLLWLGYWLVIAVVTATILYLAIRSIINHWKSRPA